ncbi:putative ATP-dependent endonuclease of OLD family [Pseudomonas sp. TE12234]
MKLLYAEFHGLPSIAKLSLELGGINALVGPNGSGKTTVLRVVKFALDLLSRRTVSCEIGEADSWLLFSSAELVFEGSKQALEHLVPGLFEVCSDRLHVKIKCEMGKFFIESLKSESEIFITSAHTVEAIEDLQSAIQEISRRIEEVQNQYNKNPHHQPIIDEMARLRSTLDQQNSKYELATQCEVMMPGTLPEVVARKILDEALSKTQFPAAVLVDSAKNLDEIIPEFIKKMCEQQSGKSADKKIFRTAHGELEHLLQHELDFHDSDGKKCLSVDGVDYRKASSGTRVSLAYFGLTRFLNSTDLVIWDEPENGLHPTRRIRVLDLILQDPRQFLIATHALEFAPIFAPDSKIYRCDSAYEEDAENTTLSVQEVTSRKDGFLLLEALGVQPARTLFTANVVLWVEGPTELVFYRHWLKKALQDKDLEEGFHYTIMHYGGGLISYLGVADDEQRQLAFDALSICRNIIIAVDSDLGGVVEGDAAQHLKPGARLIKTEVDRLNASRPGSALFCMTGGREIENYLPGGTLLYAASKCWQGYANHEAKIVVDDFSFGRYQPFHKALEAFFTAAGITTTTMKDGKEHVQVPGKSVWGDTNKVEMMRAALTMEALEPTDLLWGFSNELTRMVEFITKANAS